jgi:hypothetical protein
VLSIDPDETIRSGLSTVSMTSTTVLSETHASRCGLTHIRVMRGGLWLGECLGRLTAGLKLWTETSLDPSSRIRWRAPGESPSLVAVTASERYVACTFSFVASQTSPVFHRRSAIATIFRARVNFASSSRTPRATHAS